MYTNQRTDLSAATLSIVRRIRGYWSRTALKWSTDRENRLQYVSARTLATLRAFVNRQISPKYDPSLRLVATSPLAITMSTIPSWMKYILAPIVPSFMMISPVHAHNHNNSHYSLCHFIIRRAASPVVSSDDEILCRIQRLAIL